MSKTSQRKRDMDKLGYRDGSGGWTRRYKRGSSPGVRAYHSGYNRGVKRLKAYLKAQTENIPVTGFDDF